MRTVCVLIKMLAAVYKQEFMKIQGKNALVLGASRGIGRSIARKLASEGMRLFLPWFDWPDSCREMEAEFVEMGAGHVTLEVDLRNPVAIGEMVDRLQAEFGSLHVLVNNVERGGMPIVHGSYSRPVNAEQWQLEMETTLHAKWFVFNQCLPLLRQAEKAAVVNISSVAAVTGRSGPAGLLFNDGYAAANRGITSLTETWAREGAPTVRVNELMLGLVEQRHGPGTRGWEVLSEAEREQLLEHTLLGRTGKADEVARAVLFLIRDADFMTGACLRMDGGFVLGSERVPDMPKGVL
ncbi:3-oxoacyl-[acyl-carrier protein] reductase [Candidatus Electrothrix aarhusensis]|uniref:3-oxoacyl-[acyl-carrier protein] reductase n=1 Tax=Candidatus Electrothrix aarhusensis TaxID=1859131 RepID=A0A444IZ87_9BACT|nr:3-oxoacyl-[acyl-carrier protein] reductase [Candidatus Electrothrix aarhusensis]